MRCTPVKMVACHAELEDPPVVSAAHSREPMPTLQGNARACCMCKGRNPLVDEVAGAWRLGRSLATASRRHHIRSNDPWKANPALVCKPRAGVLCADARNSVQGGPCWVRADMPALPVEQVPVGECGILQ